MNFVIDIGNTRVKYSVFEGNSMLVENSAKQFSTERIDSFMAKYSLERCIVSAVGKFDPDVLEYLKSKISTIFLDSSTPIPIKNCYKTPQTLGCDRIAVAVAANALYPAQNVLVIDCGTAITYEVITSDAQYMGGAISPGVNLRFKSLNMFTAKLPLLTFNTNHLLVGATTEECIWAGVQNGVIAEIDGYIDALQKKYSHLEVILTGGDAKSFVNKLKNRIFVAQNLLPFGLNEILQFNSSSSM